jgi:hypothetical protein
MRGYTTVGSEITRNQKCLRQHEHGPGIDFIPFYFILRSKTKKVSIDNNEQRASIIAT